MVETAGRSPRLRHIPGLDGVRAIAVLAVIAFHGGLGWLPGGYYGVDAFFALSGFLITSLLVKEWQTSGTIGLRRFWARRARRLLPALYVMVAAVGVSVILFPTVLGTPNLFQSAMSTLFYGANWYFVASHANYFSAGFHPSPFLHTWSLAIEEQFYLLWPLIVLVVLRGSRRRAVDKTERRFQVAGDPESSLVIDSRDQRRAGRRRIETLFVVSSVGAVASAIAMAVLTPAGASTARAYYGTDTRAQSLLVGAALAALLALYGPVKTVVARRVIGSIAVAGVVGTVLIWRFVPETSSLAFHGGFLLAALSTAAIIGGAVQVPRGIVARFLSLWPLRASTNRSNNSTKHSMRSVRSQTGIFRSTSTRQVAASSRRSYNPRSNGTFACLGFARSTYLAISTDWSTPELVGSSGGTRATCHPSSFSRSTTLADPTPTSDSTSLEAPLRSSRSTTTS